MSTWILARSPAQRRDNVNASLPSNQGVDNGVVHHWPCGLPWVKATRIFLPVDERESGAPQSRGSLQTIPTVADKAQSFATPDSGPHGQSFQCGNNGTSWWLANRGIGSWIHRNEACPVSLSLWRGVRVSGCHSLRWPSKKGIRVVFDPSAI